MFSLVNVRATRSEVGHHPKLLLDEQFQTCAILREPDPHVLGCPFYSPERNAFVQAAPGERVVPRFGRSGGVLPSFGT